MGFDQVAVLGFEGALVVAVLGAVAARRSLTRAVERLTAALGRNEAHYAALRSELDALGKAVGTRLRRPLVAARGLAQEAVDAPGVRDLADSVWALDARLETVLTTAKLPTLPEPPPGNAGPGLPTLVAALRGVLVMAGLPYLLVLLRDGLATARVAGLVLCAWMVWSGVEENRLRASLWPMGLLVLLLGWLTGGVMGPLAPVVVLVAVFAGVVGERGMAGLVVTLALGMVVVETFGAEPVAPGLWAMSGVALVLGALAVRAVLDARRVTVAVLAAAERPVEAQRARWEGLEHLLERVAGELRPEAARVMDAAKTLGDGAIERVQTRLAGVVTRLERYQFLLDELALVSRPMQRSTVALNEVVAGRLEEWVAAAKARSRGVSVVSGGPEAPVALDVRRVEAIVATAVQNALEAGANVTIEVGSDTVAVCDDGPGISDAVTAKLFTVGASSRPTSAGLGLFLAKRLAEQQGATLTVAKGAVGTRVELNLRPRG